jgi:hypothetical protein
VIAWEESVTIEYVTGSVDDQKSYVAVCSGYIFAFFAVQIYVLVWGFFQEFPRRNDNRYYYLMCVIDNEETVSTEYITGCVDNQECYIAVCSGYLLVFFAVEIYVLVLRLCPGVSS